MPKPVRDTEKARRAARHPDRPGQECRAPAGSTKPVVNRGKCEGKSDCVDVCPENVFEVRRMDDVDFAQLGFFGKLKSRAHRRMSAYTPNADACRACGLCVVACPEKAITLKCLDVALQIRPTGATRAPPSIWCASSGMYARAFERGVAREASRRGSAAPKGPATSSSSRRSSTRGSPNDHSACLAPT